MSPDAKLQQLRQAEVCEVYWAKSYWALADTSTGLIAWRITTKISCGPITNQHKPAAYSRQLNFAGYAYGQGANYGKDFYYTCFT